MASHGPCEVPGCVRYAGKIKGFCNRCWTLATDGERAQIMFSRHAPFFRRFLAAADVECPTEGVVARYSYLYLDEVPLGEVLRAWEAETTQALVAKAIGDRRLRGRAVASLEEGLHEPG